MQLLNLDLYLRLRFFSLTIGEIKTVGVRDYMFNMKSNINY